MFKRIKKILWLLNENNFEEELMRKTIATLINCSPSLAKNQKVLSRKLLNEILLDTTIRTKSLLESKGFANTLEAKVEKHVLLGTEISELADAIKKGKSEDEEGYELADIVIRLSNFLSAKETYGYYIKLSQVFWNYEETLPQFITIQTYTSGKTFSNKSQIKYEIIQEMMAANEIIKITADNYVAIGVNNADPTPLINLWDACLRLIGLCYVYAETFLPEKLQFYINEKMEQNFKRPYRYNVCKEFHN